MLGHAKELLFERRSRALRFWISTHEVEIHPHDDKQQDEEEEDDVLDRTLP